MYIIYIYIISIICPNISVGSPFLLTSGVSTGQPLPCPCTGSTTTSRWSAWNASGSRRMRCSGCAASRRICGRRRWSPKNARRRVDGSCLAVGKMRLAMVRTCLELSFFSVFLKKRGNCTHVSSSILGLSPSRMPTSSMVYSRLVSFSLFKWQFVSFSQFFSFTGNSPQFVNMRNSCDVFVAGDAISTTPCRRRARLDNAGAKSLGGFQVQATRTWFRLESQWWAVQCCSKPLLVADCCGGYIYRPRS